MASGTSLRERELLPLTLVCPLIDSGELTQLRVGGAVAIEPSEASDFKWCAIRGASSAKRDAGSVAQVSVDYTE